MLVYFGKKRIIYERSYIKIQEIAANVGGVLKIMNMIFAFLIDFIDRKHLNINLINNIYELTEDVFSSKNKKNKNKAFNSTSPFVVSNSQIQKVNESKQVIKDVKVISKKTHHSKKLKFNDFQIILSLLRCNFTKHQKIKSSIYDICKYEAVEYQDIYKIISKLRELEYLKYLLLNEAQLCSFEFISKLKFGEYENQNEFTRTSNKLRNMNMNLKKMLIKNYFSKIKSDCDDKKDLKLLDIVEIIE